MRATATDWHDGQVAHDAHAPAQGHNSSPQAAPQPNLFGPSVPRQKQNSISSHGHPMNGTRAINWYHPDRLRSWQRFAPIATLGHEAKSTGTTAALKYGGGTSTPTTITVRNNGAKKPNK
jgi:hypothetical protein